MTKRTPRSPTTVLLVDDHAVVREGFRRLLECDPGVQVVGQAATSAEALMLEQRLRPDVIVLDITMPDVGGIETLKRIMTRRPDARVLMFSMHQDAVHASRAFAAGATGYLSKSSAPELLIEAVRAVRAGQRYVSPDIEGAMSRFRRKGPGPALTLSGREHEILRLLAQGYGLAEIGEQLGMSAKTVANHQSLIKQKLGAGTAMQLMVIAREMGLG